MSDEIKFPSCVGLILDGNRRWAREQGLTSLEGHRVGLLETYKDIAKHANNKGIEHLVVYMFSTENWNRSVEEVNYLMDLFREAGKVHLKELYEENIRIRFVGQREKFSPDLQKLMQEVEDESAGKTGMTAWICLSYGGRAEIVNAVNQILERNTSNNTHGVTEEEFVKYLWTRDMPDPDMIIRTGGEQRLSNFLSWQSAYSELFFTKTHWPAFTIEEFDMLIEEFSNRERRRGK